MLKVSALFPGQGSQYPGMGKSLYERFPSAREIFDEADELLKSNFTEKIFQGSEDELKVTSLTQTAIFVVSCAAFKTLGSLLPEVKFSYMAGHSLGEYSALYAAGVFDFQTGLKLVKFRGEILQSAAQAVPGAMAAVIGLEKEALEKYCSEAGSKGCCEMVNFNAPGQIVVSGRREAVDLLLQTLSGVKGVKAVPLKVSGAFHSSIMREASREMGRMLKTAFLKDAEVPVITNVDARPTTGKDEIRNNLERQIDHPVHWEETMKFLLREGMEVFIECGPGRVLSGITKKMDREKTILNVEDPDSLEKIVQKLKVTV